MQKGLQFSKRGIGHLDGSRQDLSLFLSINFDVGVRPFHRGYRPLGYRRLNYAASHLYRSVRVS